VQPPDHALLFLGQVRDQLMQEETVSSKPLGRLDALDDDAAGHRVQLRISSATARDR
jgi:hypothetical protein